MSEPSRNDHPGGPVSYVAVLPPGVTFGSTPGACLGGTRTCAASGLSPGVRLNANVGVASGRVDFKKAADSAAADAGPAGQDDEVKPDLLIDPPPPKPDDPQQPPDNTDQ